MRIRFWHNLRVSPHKILMIYKGENQLSGGGIGIPQHDQVFSINIMGGEGFQEVMQELYLWMLPGINQGEQGISEIPYVAWSKDFVMYVSQTIMLLTLSLYGTSCQLYQ